MSRDGKVMISPPATPPVRKVEVRTQRTLQETEDKAKNKAQKTPQSRKKTKDEARVRKAPQNLRGEKGSEKGPGKLSQNLRGETGTGGKTEGDVLGETIMASVAARILRDVQADQATPQNLRGETGGDRRGDQGETISLASLAGRILREVQADQAVLQWFQEGPDLPDVPEGVGDGAILVPRSESSSSRRSSPSSPAEHQEKESPCAKYAAVLARAEDDPLGETGGSLHKTWWPWVAYCGAKDFEGHLRASAFLKLADDVREFGQRLGTQKWIRDRREELTHLRHPSGTFRAEFVRHYWADLDARMTRSWGRCLRSREEGNPLRGGKEEEHWYGCFWSWTVVHV